MRDEIKPKRHSSWSFSSLIPPPSSLKIGTAGSRTPISCLQDRRPVHPDHASHDSVESRGIAPRSPACDAGVFLLDDDPNLERRTRSAELGTKTRKQSLLSANPNSQHNAPNSDL